MPSRNVLSLIKHDLCMPHSVLRKSFFLLLLFFLIVTLILQTMLFRTAGKSAQQRVQEDNRALLSSLIALSDASFSKLADNSGSVAWNDDIVSLLVFPARVSDHQIFNVVRALQSFAAEFPYVERVSLLCRGNDTVYSSSGEAISLYKAALSDLSAPPVGYIGSEDYTLVQTQDGQLCLLCHLVAGSTGYLGTLFVYIDTAPFFSAICGENEQLVIFSASGTLLYSGTTPVSYGQTFSAPSHDSYLLQSSTLTQLSFYHACEPVVFPLGAYITSGNGIIMIFVILPLICLLSLLAAWALYRPLHNLLGTLQENTENSDPSFNEWSRLAAALNQMSTKSAQYDNISQFISPYVQRELLCSLLDGGELDEKTISETLSGAKSLLPVHGTFALFVTRNRQTGVLSDTVIQQTVQRLQKLTAPHCQFFSFAYQYSVLTIAATTETLQDRDVQISKILHTIAVYTSSTADADVCCSPPFFCLSDIAKAYKQALSASRQEAVATSNVMKLQQQLTRSIGAITDQQEEAGILVINHLLSSIEDASLSDEERMLCYRVFLSEFAKLADSYRVKHDAPPHICRETAAADAERYAKEILHLTYINLDNRQHKYLVEATQYMDQHYNDPNLSLNQLAVTIGISSSYLSRIFNDSYHMRFTQRLNGLRIEKSKELLRDQTLLIRDVSTSVGFLTVQTFMRVFKHYTGITPSEYRTAQMTVGKEGLPEENAGG